MTPAASYAGSAVSDPDASGEMLICATRNSSDNPDILRQLGAVKGQPLGDEIRLAMLNSASKKVNSSVNSLNDVEANSDLVGGHSPLMHLPVTERPREAELEVVEAEVDDLPSPPPPEVPKRSTSYDMLRNGPKVSGEVRATVSEVKRPPPHQGGHPQVLPKLSPPTPFADIIEDNFVANRLPHLMVVNQVKSNNHLSNSKNMSKTLPRRLHLQNNKMEIPTSKQLSVNRKSLTEATIPPPPQYKGVHFAPQVEERRRSADDEDLIPVEGLPTKPAMPRPHSVRLPSPATTPTTPPPAPGETIAITVRKVNPVPILNSVVNKATTPTSGPPSTFGASSSAVGKTPPIPPPKTSTLSSKGQLYPHVLHHGQVMGVRDKALAASAAGREIVFVSPDEGFNEDSIQTVVTSNSTSAAASQVLLVNGNSSGSENGGCSQSSKS